jgi:hypothetical protein
MIEMFDINEGRVVISPVTLLVPEFKAVHEHYNDINVFCYIAFRTSMSPTNIYRDVEEDKIDETLMRDFPGNYKPTDDLVVAALVRYYRSIKDLVDKLAAYASNAIVDDSKEGNITHLIKLVEKANSIILTFMKAEKDIESILPTIGKASNKKKLAYDLT